MSEKPTRQEIINIICNRIKEIRNQLKREDLRTFSNEIREDELVTLLISINETVDTK